MTISRWKIMAGMFALALGGVYAAAGQGPDKSAERMGKAPQPAIAFCEPPLVVPAAALVPPVPAPPALLVIPAAAVELPSALPVAPTVPAPALLEPQAPPALALPDAGTGKLPPLPAAAPKCDLDWSPRAATPIRAVPASFVPVGSPSAPYAGELPGAAAPMPAAPALPQTVSRVVPEQETVALPSASVAPPAPQAYFPPASPEGRTAVGGKFRIVLRVGDGEPMFEVRNGDDLLMKVLCERVDVKAPEKGQTMSAVKAMGKVRFVGFGSEGACEELSFLAGTGEVQLSGGVKVQMKDKLGRVESELSADKMQYRLDAAHALTGGLQP